MSIPKEHKIVAVAQIISVIGLVILWMVFHFSTPVMTDTDGYRFVFDTT